MISQPAFLKEITLANQGKPEENKPKHSKYRYIQHQYGLITFGNGSRISDLYYGIEEDDFYFVQPDEFASVITSLQKHNTASIDHKALHVVRKYEWDSSEEYESEYTHHISAGQVMGTISLDEQLTLTFALHYEGHTPPSVIERSQKDGREQAISKHKHYLEVKQ